jgi:hypothetical protein
MSALDLMTINNDSHIFLLPFKTWNEIYEINVVIIVPPYDVCECSVYLNVIFI